MSSQPLWWVGNRNPSITETITVNGVPYDLTSSTVTFSMRPVGSSTAKVNAQTAVIVNAAQGQVRYDWQATDVDTAGQYLCWWTVTTGIKTQDVSEAIIEFRAHSNTNIYCELEQLKSSLEQTGTSYDDQDVHAALVAASRCVDDYCDRRFYLDADASQVRYYDIPSMDLVPIDDLVVLTSLLVDEDGDGVFEQTWTQGSDFILAPYNAAVWGRPYTKIRWQPTGRFVFISPYPKSVKVTGQFGWPAIPPQVSTATAILASRLLKRIRETPLGVMGVGIDGAAVRITKEDADVAALLAGVSRRGGGLIV